MIGGLDFKLRTPTPSNSRPMSSTSTNPNTPRTAKDAVRSSINLKNKIARHQSSFFTHLYKLVDTQAKGISKLAHKMVLLETENKTLHTANELLSKRKKTKKTCVRIERLFNVLEANALQSLKGEIRTEEINMSKNDSRTKEVISHVRRCGKCNQPGHNARTCELESVVSKEKNDI